MILIESWMKLKSTKEKINLKITKMKIRMEVNLQLKNKVLLGINHLKKRMELSPTKIKLKLRVPKNWTNLSPMNIQTNLKMLLLSKRTRPIMKKTKLRRTVTGNWFSLNLIWTTPATFHPSITPMQWSVTVSQQKANIL